MQYNLPKLGLESLQIPTSRVRKAGFTFLRFYESEVQPGMLLLMKLMCAWCLV